MTTDVPMLDLSIIIVNYNTRELTQACIDSVFGFVRLCRFEVVLVDNASTDGSRDLFSQDSRITYIYMEENIGFGRANNRGLEVASGRNILFLNPDTLLLDDAPSRLSSYLDSHPEVGACGGNLLTADMLPNQSFMRYRPSLCMSLHFLTWNVWYRLRGDRNLTFNFTSTPIPVGYIIGADLAIRREVLDEVGAFDSDFFLYYEETDLCDRIARAGYQLHCLPDVRIIHYEGQSIVSDRKKEHMERSRQLYLEKRYPVWHIALINALHGLWRLVHDIHHRVR